MKKPSSEMHGTYSSNRIIRLTVPPSTSPNEELPFFNICLNIQSSTIRKNFADSI